MKMAGRYYFTLVEDERTVVDEFALELEAESDVHSEARRSARWIAASYGDGRRPDFACVRVQAASGGFSLEVPICT
jgi:hypothetical protein